MRRRDRSNAARPWQVLLVLLGTAAVLLSLASPGSEPAAQAATAPVASSDRCGAPVPKRSGGLWTCTFADDFDGDGLDRSKWLVLTTARHGIRNGPECYRDTSATVSVKRGSLVLTARDMGRVTKCRSGYRNRDFKTRYAAGEVSTLGKFSQAYGRVAFRASFPHARVAGLHSAMWLWPERLSYGPWPVSGEIDVAEFYTRYPHRIIPYVHYASVPADPTVTKYSCMLRNAAKFHTYVLQWTPGHLLTFIDGVECLDHRVRSVVPPSNTAPFNKPFALNFAQAFGSRGNEFKRGTTPLPASMRVKYIRVWK